MTDNFLCIPNECTRIKYQLYKKSGGVRYRYPGQDWRLVDGDDFEIEDNRLGQCEETYYLIEYEYYTISGLAGTQSVNTRTKSVGLGLATVVNPISEEVYYPDGGQPSTHLGQPIIIEERLTGIKYQKRLPDGTVIEGYLSLVPSSGVGAVPGSVIPKIKRLDGKPDDCGDCTLKIFKNGQVVFERTADQCPEAEILDSGEDGINCELSDRTEQIKIEKLPFLQRIEIRDQSIDPIYVSPLAAPLLDTNPLPDECLNIYKTYVAAPPFLSNYVPLPGFINPYEFVAQICSAPGCPPPKYEVICDCGESCPDGTCATSCGDVVCCHDSTTGIAVHQIPIEDYVGGQS